MAKRLGGAPQAVASGRATPEMASLAERMLYVQALRGAFCLVVFGSLFWAPDLVGIFAAELGVFAVGYLVLAVVVETLRKRIPNPRYAWVVGMLLGDGVFLACVMYATGGADSPLRFLVYLHVLTVTLLASYRTGLRITAWHTILAVTLLFVPEIGPGANRLLPTLDGPTRLALYNVIALWLVAGGTAACSALNERDLRRAKLDLQARAEMASDFEKEQTPRGVARILLTKVAETFGFVRGVVIASPQGEHGLLASYGDVITSAPIGIDRTVTQAWETHETVRLRKLAPEREPHLAALLPDGKNALIVPLFADGMALGALVLEATEDVFRLERRALAMLEQFAAHGALAIRNASLLEEVRRLADTDPLTGIANRRTFETTLERELHRAERTGEELSLIMIDLDHFKQINDAYGHQVGDDVLQRAAVALVESSRDFDLVARYGGEEFALILPACSQADSQAVAERFRHVVGEILDVPAVTASGGVATFPHNAMDAQTLVRAADDALYLSKRLGRDRLTVSPSTPRPAGGREAPSPPTPIRHGTGIA